jgi:hypothetical protein
MKRILLGLSVVVGTLVMGLTNASAAEICSDDPTLGVGTPVTYSLNVSLLGGGTVVYASGTSKTTTFGFVLGTK